MELEQENDVMSLVSGYSVLTTGYTAVEAKMRWGGLARGPTYPISCSFGLIKGESTADGESLTVKSCFSEFLSHGCNL